MRRKKTAFVIISMLTFIMLIASIPSTKAAVPYAYEEDGSDTVGWTYGTYLREGGETFSSDGDILSIEVEGDSDNDVDYAYNTEITGVTWEADINILIRYRMSSMDADSFNLNFLGYDYDGLGAAINAWWIALPESTSWNLLMFDIDDMTVSGSPVSPIETILFRCQMDSGIDVDLEINFIRIGIEWNIINTAILKFVIPLYMGAFDGLVILLGLIMIPASTLFLVYGGRKNMSSDKLFFFLILFVMGWALFIGGITP